MVWYHSKKNGSNQFLNVINGVISFPRLLEFPKPLNFSVRNKNRAFFGKRKRPPVTPVLALKAGLRELQPRVTVWVTLQHQQLLAMAAMAHEVNMAGWWLSPTPLKNDGVKVRWADDIPKILKHKINVPNHQPNGYNLRYNHGEKPISYVSWRLQLSPWVMLEGWTPVPVGNALLELT